VPFRAFQTAAGACRAGPQQMLATLRDRGSCPGRAAAHFSRLNEGI
jgi:hypothetical protein